MKPSSQQIAHVTQVGVKKTLPDGSIQHTGRHPNQPDEEVVVTTKDGKVMRANATNKPMHKVFKEKKEKDAAIKVKKDNSVANRKAQLEKKRARSAAANNKNTKK